MSDQKRIESLLRDNGMAFEGPTRIQLIKQHNHIYQIQTDGWVGFLKLYTKDWYGDDIAGTGYCVDHEIAAWQTLASAGLAVPEVLLADGFISNSLQRPFLMTRRLEGAPLTTLAQQADAPERAALLNAVGSYLAQMHRIRFEFPGYITSKPLAPLQADEWQHPIWTFEAFERDALATWQRDREQVSDRLMDQVERFSRSYRAELEKEYRSPRFVHGDCHASQFFLLKREGVWHVTGVLDMEVASAGDMGADFVKFSLEMAALLPAETAWWQPLLEGYSTPVNFNLIKLRLLALGHHNYAWIWPGTREQIITHLLKATDWYSLFDLTHLRNSLPL